LNYEQKNFLKFGVDFEQKFLNQKVNENRNFETTLNLAWEVLSNLTIDQLFRIHQRFLDKYYKTKV
ncbi:unnamed protein product, partial [marine sediment metagenome]